MSISTLEASIKTGLGSGYISKLCQTGVIPAEKICNRWCIDEEALDEYIQDELVFHKKRKQNCDIPISKSLVEAFNNSDISKSGLCRLIIKEYPEIGIRHTTIQRDFDIKKAPAERIDIYNKFFGICEDDLNETDDVVEQSSDAVKVKKIIERMPVSPEGMTEKDLFNFVHALNASQLAYFNCLLNIQMFYNQEKKKYGKE